MVRQPVEEECCAYKQEQYSVGEPAFAMYRSMQLRGVTLFDQMGKPTVIWNHEGEKRRIRQAMKMNGTGPRVMFFAKCTGLSRLRVTITFAEQSLCVFPFLESSRTTSVQPYYEKLRTNSYGCTCCSPLAHCLAGRCGLSISLYVWEHVQWHL